MNIAIISTRGIPNNYGGFEQFAEYISTGLSRRGHSVTVYSPHYHPYKENAYSEVHIKHIYSPEQWMGGAVGSFIYDYFSFKDAIKDHCFDIIYVCGYTSIIPAYIRFCHKKCNKPIIVTNMDGLEYKRTKFNKLVRKFIFWEEKKAIQYSDYLVSDNIGIRDYYLEKYNRESKYLGYGATVSNDFSESYLSNYNLKAFSYYIAIARMEPENNIETIIEGYIKSKNDDKPLILVGKTNTKFAKYLLKKYSQNKNIIFSGGIYDYSTINSLRHFSLIYFHGHSVGGTNPSLLEAMASKCFIAVHDNSFNKSVISCNSPYFSTDQDISEIINNYSNILSKSRNMQIEENLDIIKNEYSWEKIIDDHEKYFKTLI